MHKITLVCSTHREQGLCNSEALFNILRTIGPEVVFVEIRAADFDAYKRGALPIPEAQVITRYREFRPCQEVPVDWYDIRADLLLKMKAELDKVIDFVGRSSAEYRQLDEQHAKHMVEHGYDYLNSDAFAMREARMSEIEVALIRATGHQDAIRALEKWRQFIHSRDVEMVANIYEYCRANVFETGVFLVGAAHKLGIIKEIEKYASKEPDLIDWKLLSDRQP